MTDRLRQVLESKRALRKDLATRTFAEKLKILEELRARSQTIAATPLRQRQPSKS